MTQTPTEVAELIEFAKIYLLQIDIKSLEEIVHKFHAQNSRNHSLTALSSDRARLDKNALFSKSTESIELLLKFIKSLVEVQEYKDKLKANTEVYDQIESLFA